MGIFIHLAISDAVTKEEWNRVYEESLDLVRKFPLAERRTVKLKDIDTICLVRTEEHEMLAGWDNEESIVGWWTSGDYETLHTAESYFLPRDLIGNNAIATDVIDAMFGAFPAYMNYDWEEPRAYHIYNLWGDKTQGEPYHMYLLAIACMIESRLGKKAFVYGDITRGQCQKAVDMANKYLKTPIGVPDRCNLERFEKRVSKLPVTPMERLKIFERFYLGTKGAEFGEFVRSRFSEEICDEYWRGRFQSYSVETIGFDDCVRDYLLWGFGLEELCYLVACKDKENNPQCEAFIKRIMDAKLHKKEKYCEDMLRIDQEESTPYTVNTLMAQFIYAGARNKKVDRYIPVDEIREALKRGLGNVCDVERIIDEYMEAEAKELSFESLKNMKPGDENIELVCKQNASEFLGEVLNVEKQILEMDMKKYDITLYEDLLYYEKADKVHPCVEENLKKVINFYKDLLNDEKYKKLMDSTPKFRCKWLIENNRNYLFRDIDWEKIFENIEEADENYARYYPMMRININSEELLQTVTALALNDELYDFCIKMTENAERDKV